MERKGPYELVYDQAVFGHLKTIDRRHHSMIRDGIERMLRHEPTTETRNRKPLVPGSPLAESWEIRFGPANRFRAFYRVDEALRRVRVLAVGMKTGNRLVVGGEEWTL